MLADDKIISIDAPHRVITTVFAKENVQMIHFVNGIGQRPLQENIPCFDISVTVKLGGRKVRSVESKIAAIDVRYEVDGDILLIKLPRLDVWDALLIEYEN